MGLSQLGSDGITSSIIRRHRKKNEDCIIPSTLANRLPAGPDGCVISLISLVT